jgi:hypothetical protein
MVEHGWSGRLDEAGLYAWTAADAEASRADGDSSANPLDGGAAVDVVALRRGLLPNLGREFAALSAVFDEWLTAGHRKHAADALRVLWLVGIDGPHRAKALLACLARARLAGRAVGDAGRDPRLLAAAVAHPAAEAEWVIGVNLSGGQPGDGWTDLLTSIDQARRRSPGDPRRCPLLVIAGTDEQEQRAYDTLGPRVEVTPVDPGGRPRERPHSHAGAQAMSSQSLPAEHIFNRGLPMTTHTLFGRAAELRALDAAWESPDTRIASVVAYGGTGKSALINNWLADLRKRDWRGAQRVFAWSFYSQGTKDNLVSADPFVSSALDWLGDSADGVLVPWARGLRLAKLIKEHRFLLVLDGLEPLQHPLSVPGVGGQLTDDSMRALLEELASPDWNGLCVITTRVPVTDLERFELPSATVSAPTAARWHLENLSDEAGADLLRAITGTRASRAAVREVAHELEGHALAVTLLGNYLRDVHGGDLAGRFDLEKLTLETSAGGHARRIMESYAKWLRGHGQTTEMTILRVIGLFDRPAPPEAIEAVMRASVFGADADLGARPGDGAWNRGVDALRRMGLLNSEQPDSPGALDAHPLVREHFHDDIQRIPRAWERGNRALFDHYLSQAPEQPADTRAMNLLYAAVTHGCAAGIHQKVFDEVLLPSVWRDRRTSYSTRRLGMTSSDLVALSNFFADHRWTDLVGVPLTDRARILIQTNAGVRLRQLGRLGEARDCFGAVMRGITMDAGDTQQMEDAAYVAAAHCELLVIAGSLGQAAGDPGGDAVSSGRRAVEYADRGADGYFAMHARSSLAEVYFMLGRMDLAEEQFAEAREIEWDRRCRPPFDYSQSLFRYGYFLIESGRGGEPTAMTHRYCPGPSGTW